MSNYMGYDEIAFILDERQNDGQVLSLSPIFIDEDVNDLHIEPKDLDSILGKPDTVERFKKPGYEYYTVRYHYSTGDYRLVFGFTEMSGIVSSTSIEVSKK